MGEPHLDHPGEIHWFHGYGPAKVLGPCPHTTCRHDAQHVIAWGPSMARYELVVCDVDGGCAGSCRAWIDGQGRVTSEWLQVGDATAPTGRSVVHTSQPMPVITDGESIQSMVRQDLITREQVGISRYGTPLQAGNGRDALVDAYEEALDLACYLRQAIEERGHRCPT